MLEQTLRLEEAFELKKAENGIKLITISQHSGAVIRTINLYTYCRSLSILKMWPILLEEKEMLNMSF